MCLGERYSDALFGNGHAVLQAADECGAAVVLLSDEALPLAEVDSFLARAAARGVRVFRAMSPDAPALGWILCSTDKPPLDDGTWRTCQRCGLIVRRGEPRIGALRVPVVRRLLPHVVGRAH